MYTKTGQRKSIDTIDIYIAERDNQEDDDKHQQIKSSKNRHLSDLTMFNLSTPISNDKSAAYISQLLHEANLPTLVQLDTVNQIKYFLDERVHMINQMELARTQYEKQYSLLKRRLDETETENEHLTTQYRSASKELILYKNLIEAPMNPDSPRKSKDYQQLKLTMEKILQENQYLYTELNHFKTSDPVYEQVKLLETTNKHLKLRLTKIIEECEQLKTMNQKLLQQQTLSTKQFHHSSTSPLPSNQQQFSPKSRRSSRSSLEDNLLLNYSPNEILQLREQVQRLEQTLQKRDHELQKLQNEIEKGTSSIMSSIEDLYIVSSNVSSNNIL